MCSIFDPADARLLRKPCKRYRTHTDNPGVDVPYSPDAFHSSFSLPYRHGRDSGTNAAYAATQTPGCYRSRPAGIDEA